MYRLLLVAITILWSPFFAHAQLEKKLLKEGKANVDSFRFNERDREGKPTGLWYRLHPEERGEESFWEFGYYLAGLRNGAWYKLSKEGELRSIENYRNSVLSGEAKYFESGRLATIGHYRGYNPVYKFDTVLVVDPVTLEETLVPVEQDHVVTKHGSWKYYEPTTGQLIKEEEWQVDELIFQKKYPKQVADSATIEALKQRLPHNKSKGKAVHSSGRSLIEGE